jgi:hypothetical protein
VKDGSKKAAQFQRQRLVEFLRHRIVPRLVTSTTDAAGTTAVGQIVFLIRHHL